ncbi:MAG TPA: heavy metal-binding domain-containing protein [Acidimicrobiales bacterium]|nr:heavy metal-binding domain-containing protein [Acidimicrobiales bacterium]
MRAPADSGAAAATPSRRPDIGAALETLRSPYRPDGTGARDTFLSDLTVGELILLEEVGYAPVEIVSGAGSASWYPQFTTAGTEARMWGEAIATAIAAARSGIYSEVSQRAAHGVVAMRLELERERANLLTCTMLGTAVRATGETGQKPKHREGPFTTSLSARDFHLLTRAGYQAAGIVIGASVVGFNARSAAQSLGLARENMELEAQTNALYSAREQAMAMMEREALSLKADGVVAVELSERPVNTMLTHAVELVAIGTAVRRGPAGHKPLDPTLQLSLDDPTPEVFSSG